MSIKRERIAIISGFRTAMGKAGGVFKNLQADDMAASLIKEILIKSKVPAGQIDEVIFGNVAQPGHAANIARVIALKAGLEKEIPAYTVHRNCASGMQSLTSAATQIWAGRSQVVLVGGVESMSNIPLMFNAKMTGLFAKLARAKTIGQKLAAIASFRPSFLKPIIGVQQGLTDPVSGLIMGCTAENVARKFKITRKEQDEFALKSHQLAQKATESGILAEEIIPIYSGNPKNSQMVEKDEGIRANQKMADLAKLKPYFERHTGAVTVGNSSQLTDGAAAMIVASESKAKELEKKYGVEILGYLSDFAYAGLEPGVMGLGPVHAAAKLFEQSGKKLNDFDLVEINEAFAAQVIGCQKAFASDEFSQEELGLKQALGEINPDILNVNGGAIALGHPVGMSGMRLVIHLLRELKRRKKKRGLATLCVGGGQGSACFVEAS